MKGWAKTRRYAFRRKIFSLYQFSNIAVKWNALLDFFTLFTLALHDHGFSMKKYFAEPYLILHLYYRIYSPGTFRVHKFGFLIPRENHFTSWLHKDNLNLENIMYVVGFCFVVAVVLRKPFIHISRRDLDTKIIITLNMNPSETLFYKFKSLHGNS